MHAWLGTYLHWDASACGTVREEVCSRARGKRHHASCPTLSELYCTSWRIRFREERDGCAYRLTGSSWRIRLIWKREIERQGGLFVPTRCRPRPTSVQALRVDRCAGPALSLTTHAWSVYVLVLFAYSTMKQALLQHGVMNLQMFIRTSKDEMYRSTRFCEKHARPRHCVSTVA